MLLPHTYLGALLLLLLSMGAWGSWANAQKFDPALRYELFYWDYMWGLTACAVLIGLVFGAAHPSAPDSLFNSLRQAGAGKALDAVAGGVVFDAGNILLVAAIAVGGMAVAFPIGAGLGLVIGTILNYLVRPAGNPWLLFPGIALVCVAIVLDALAYRSLRRTGQRRVAAILLSGAAGVLIGLFYPFVAKASNGAGHLTPYAVLVLFAGGAVVSNVPFNYVLMRHPVTGRRLALRDYRRLNTRAHALGWIGGAIWAAGTGANFVASAVPKVGPAVSFALGEGNTLISAIWGVAVWHEFRGASPAARRELTLMFICFVLGLVGIALAPVWMQ